MPNIFISYRREDSLGHTGRLFDRLGKHFGKAHVFMDIAGIEPGLDFVEAIDKAVGSCDVFIVVIGKQWLNATDADGRRRLENPEDFIHLELGTALKRNIRVIPVLVQGATAPSSENLPEDLRMLSRRQAQEVSDNRFDFDAGELIKTIERSLRGKYPLRFWWSKIPRWAVVVFLAALFVAGVNIFFQSEQTEPGIDMPNVVGERFEKAKAILTDKGLSVSTSEKQTGEKPPGTVVGQKPEPGTKMKKGDQVDLVLAVRPIIKMPNVLGRHLDDAKAALQKAGLAGPEVKDRKTNEKSPGIVLKQTPEPGAEVEPGQRVLLEVAVKSGISVPNVVGEQSDKARAIMAEKGLEVLMIEKQTDEKPPGTVVDQNPKQGKEAEKGQRVELVIASEPTMAKEQRRRTARNLANEWFVAIYKRQDVGALVRMASFPFFFDNEVVVHPKDFEKKWKDIFSQVTSKGEDLSTYQLKDIKAQTISEWKKEGYDVQRDRFLKKMEYNDGDFKISILVEKGDRKHGQALYTRNVGGQIKLAGFWD
jgi:beta-lactam-binding protein with PASTA domain